MVMTRGEKIYLVVLACAALVLRLFYHHEMRGNVLVEHLQLDEQFHDRWARSIADGNVIGEGVFFHAPLYPYILGLVYFLFGDSYVTPRILQHVLGSMAVVLIYILGRSLFGRRAAVIASLLGALYAVLIYFEGRLLFDFLVTFLALLWLTIVVLFAEKPTVSKYLFFGVFFGLICTMRPTFVTLAPPLFIYVLWKYVDGKENIVRHGLALGIGVLMPILLVTVRNALVGGDFVVLASQGGINFYIGNNPLSDGCTPSVPEAGGVAWENRQVEYIAAQALGHEPRPSEISSYWFGRAREFIRNEPLAFLRLQLKKFYLFWSHIEIVNNHSYYWFERSSILLRWLPVGFWLVGTLGLVGAIRAWKEPRARLLILFLGLYCIVTMAFFVCDRFRLPIIPLLCIFSGYTIHFVLTSAKAGRWASVGRTVVLCAASAVLVNTNFAQLRPEENSGEDELKGLVALDSGDLMTAAEMFGRVASVQPWNSGARVNQGVALWKMGRIDEALSAFRAGIGAESYDALLNLAHLFFTLQRLDSAGFYADRAISARPFAPGGYVIAAKIFMVQQDMRRAESVLLQGNAECGDDFIYGRFLLSGICFQKGSLAASDSGYRNVLLQTTRLTNPEYTMLSEKSRFGEDLPILQAKSLLGLGRIFTVQQRLDSGVVYFRAATHVLPNNAEVWADFGLCLLNLNRLDEAEEAMSKAVRLGRNTPPAWYNYSIVLARKGEFERAKHAASQAIELNPRFEEAKRLMKTLEENAELNTRGKVIGKGR